MSEEWKTRHSVISSDGTVKYDLMMSLQNIAIAKIITTLWMNEKTLKWIADTYQRQGSVIDLKVFEENIVGNLSHFFLPKCVFQKMTDAVKDLRNSLVCWIDYHDYILHRYDSIHSAVSLMNNVTWTSRGRIDYEQTAKNIFANQNILLDDKTKCRLACNYCLEDEIKLLAPNVFEMFEPLHGHWEPMVYFWIKYIKGELNSSRIPRRNNMSDNEYIMQSLLRNYGRYNDIPIRFMWNRLSEEERERNITLLVKSIDNKDYLFSLLSNLSYDQQQKVFKECPEHVLLCMLNDWRWGEYFLPTTFFVLKSLEFDKPLEYWEVLTNIIYRLCIDCEDVKKCIRDKYKSVFKRLWRETSIECKDYIIQLNGLYSIEYFLAIRLSWERDTDIAEAILKDLTAEQKKNIAFGEDAVYCCIKFIKNCRWDLLESFLKHTLSTEEDFGHMKKKLLEDGKLKFLSHFSKCGSVDEIERFLEWAFETEDEREKYKRKCKKKKFKRKVLAYFF